MIVGNSAYQNVHCLLQHFTGERGGANVLSTGHAGHFLPTWPTWWTVDMDYIFWTMDLQNKFEVDVRAVTAACTVSFLYFLVHRIHTDKSDINQLHRQLQDLVIYVRIVRLYYDKMVTVGDLASPQTLVVGISNDKNNRSCRLCIFLSKFRWVAQKQTW